MNIIQAAKSYLGTREGSEAFKKLIDKYNALVSKKAGGYQMKYTDPWCAAFASLCAAEAGLTCFPWSVNCQSMYKWAVNNGRLSGSPSVGGLILFDWNHDGVADHVGIVTGFSGLTVDDIEGNTSDRCAAKTYARNNAAIMGYIKLAEVPAEVIVEEPESAASTVPVLRKGSNNEWVKAMQWLLIARGISVGPDGADGDFGRNTENAVLSFQRSHNLEVDGIVGPKTWAGLVGV